MATATSTKLVLGSGLSFSRKTTTPGSFSLNRISGVRLLFRLHSVIVIKHVAYFTVCAKFTMAFTFTSLPFSFHTSVSRCGCGFGSEKNIGGSADLVKKIQIRGLAYPIHTPPFPRPLSIDIRELTSLRYNPFETFGREN